MDYLTNLFVKGNGVFAKNLQFEVIVLSLVIIMIFTRVFGKNYGFVIILIGFVYYIANTYVGVKTGDLDSRNEQTMIKLQRIQNVLIKLVNRRIRALTNSNQKLSPADKQKMQDATRADNLYIDSDMIRFIHAIIPFSEYNGPEFSSFVRGVDNILKIRREIEEFHDANAIFPETTSEMFEIAIGLKSNTINNLHNFVYSIPKQRSMLEYLDSIVEKYNILISRNMDMIQKYYLMNINQRGIKSTTKFVSYNEAKPYDSLSNHLLTPSKAESKLINFYY
jgi:hypothetical protein